MKHWHIITNQPKYSFKRINKPAPGKRCRRCGSDNYIHKSKQLVFNLFTLTLVSSNMRCFYWPTVPRYRGHAAGQVPEVQVYICILILCIEQIISSNCQIKSDGFIPVALAVQKSRSMQYWRLHLKRLLMHLLLVGSS